MKGKKPNQNDRSNLCEQLDKLKTHLANIQNKIADVNNVLKKNYWNVEDMKLVHGIRTQIGNTQITWREKDPFRYDCSHGYVYKNQCSTCREL